MKKLALLILTASALSFTSCQSVKDNISQDDLDKALEFAKCSQACYTKIYGQPSPELPAE